MIPKKLRKDSIHHPDYDKRTIQRMFKNSKKVGDCIISTLKPNKHGYPQISYKGKTIPNHRLAFKLIGKEDLNPEMDIHHKCWIKACFKVVDHLEQITKSEHMRLEHEHRASLRPKDLCKRGHSLVDNFYINSSGSHICKTCSNIDSKKYYDSHKEESKEYRESHKEEAKEYQKEYQPKYKFQKKCIGEFLELRNIINL